MLRLKLFFAFIIGLSVASAKAREVISERDYLDDMPIVLSVSRLPQRLDETPGAVTVLDRGFIRSSGARDVADLLRWVPGFQASTSFEAVAPVASYHGGFDQYSNRMQVQVDGRSVYSPYFIGGVGSGLQTVAMQDIERIEVLRGSNSASYGARAMLGVVNIVTRQPQDTLGSKFSLTRGEGGIFDTQASFGWGLASGAVRLGVDRRADDGLLGANGQNQLNRVNLRADVRTDAGNDWQLRAGMTALTSGKGQLGSIEARSAQLDTSFIQLDWRRNLDMDSDLAVSLSQTQEKYADTISAYNLNYDGVSSNTTLTTTHTFRLGAEKRIVWGGEFRSESIVSKSFYNQDNAMVTEYSRIFGNLEWRLGTDWLLNAGALAEHSSVAGSSVAPRVMINWHFLPGHTLRAGASRAYRPPSTFEKSANLYLMGAPYILASGNVTPESLKVTELGYLVDLPKNGLSGDLRVFREALSGFIRQQNNTPTRDYANDEDFAIQGWEYQLKWRPWSGAQLILNQTYTDNSSMRYGTGTAYAAPKMASSLVWMQKLSCGLDLTLMHQDSGTATLQGSGLGSRVAMTRTDLRLGWPLRWGAHTGELALTLQNLGLPYQDYDPDYLFLKRALITLRLDN